MLKKIVYLSLLFSALSLGAETISLDAEHWRLSGGKAETVMLEGEKALKVTGPATLELREAFAVDPAGEYRMQGEFLASGGINRFGVRCFTDTDDIVPERIVRNTKVFKVLRTACRAEDCDLYVNDVDGLHRQYGLQIVVGEDWIAADLGRFFTDADGGVITLYAPVGRTLPAGTKITFGYRSCADIYFGGILRGLGIWRSFDCTTMKGMHSNDFHQRRLHPDTRKVRILLKINENAAPDAVAYVKNLQFFELKK